MSESSPPRESPGQRPKDPWLRRFWMALGLVVVLGAAGWLGARPAYRWAKAERARRMVDRIAPAVEAGRWDEVVPVARLAVGLAPDEPRVRWLLARHGSAAGTADALETWPALAGLGPLSRADRIAWATLALRHDRLDVAGRLVAELLSGQADDPDVLRLATALAARQGDMAASVALAREWLATRPEDPEPQWELGRRLAAAREPSARGEARRLLWPLLLRTNPWQESAGAVLAADPDLTRGEREQVRRELRRADASERVLAALDLALEPDRRKDILASMAARAGQETNRAEMGRQIAWLAENGAIEEILTVLTPERIASDPDLAGTRLQALLEVGRTEEARAEMELPGSPVDETLRHCLGAWTAREAGRESEADDRLTAAVASAGRSSGRLRFVAEYALRLGRDGPAARAYERLLEVPDGAVSAGRSLASLAIRSDNVPALRRALDSLRRRLPGDAGIRTLAIYLAFLQGDSDPAALGWVAEVAEQPGASATVFAARALGRWRLGQSPQGLEELESIDPGLLASEPRLRLAHALLLSGSQRREAARTIAREIPADRLLGEERRLLADGIR